MESSPKLAILVTVATGLLSAVATAIYGIATNQNLLVVALFTMGALILGLATARVGWHRLELRDQARDK